MTIYQITEEEYLNIDEALLTPDSLLYLKYAFIGGSIYRVDDVINPVDSFYDLLNIYTKYNESLGAYPGDYNSKFMYLCALGLVNYTPDKLNLIMSEIGRYIASTGEDRLKPYIPIWILLFSEIEYINSKVNQAISLYDFKGVLRFPKDMSLGIKAGITSSELLYHLIILVSTHFRKAIHLLSQSRNTYTVGEYGLVKTVITGHNQGTANEYFTSRVFDALKDDLVGYNCFAISYFLINMEGTTFMELRARGYLKELTNNIEEYLPLMLSDNREQVYKLMKERTKV